MKNEPLISVIIPIYNVSEYIDACVTRIINQTYNNLEIILVDDITQTEWTFDMAKTPIFSP